METRVPPTSAPSSKWSGSSPTTNAITPVAKAAAQTLGLPLYQYLGGVFANTTPFPLGNVLGGGRHAVGGTDIQEFSALSMGPTIKESIFANAAVHASVKRRLVERFPDRAIGKGDECAWVAELGNEEALQLDGGVQIQPGAPAKFVIARRADGSQVVWRFDADRPGGFGRGAAYRRAPRAPTAR